MIEGTIIAGLAIGAKMGFIYLRGEYRYLLKIMEKAIADAYAKGFLGKNIFGSGLTSTSFRRPAPALMKWAKSRR